MISKKDEQTASQKEMLEQAVKTKKMLRYQIEEGKRFNPWANKSVDTMAVEYAKQSALVEGLRNALIAEGELILWENKPE